MKFKVSIILLFIFGISGIPSIMKISASTLAMQQFDKSTMIKKKLADAQKFISNEDYIAAQNTLNSLLKLDPNNAKAKELLEECESGIKKQKQKEYQAYQDACKSVSTDALNGFIRRYPNSEYVKSARQRLDDYSIWEIAMKRNTIDSYNLYLQESSVLAYKGDAQAAIKKLKADQAWEACVNTDNESLLNDFISTYPESPHLGEARYKLNLLKGERMYGDGFFDVAYSYLNEANSFRTLTGVAASHYKELIDKKNFNEILASSDIDKVRKYLNTLSFSSPYYNDTSNHLALLLGKRISAWSSDYSMDEALAFAKDESTRATVKKYINQSKEIRRKYERERKAMARKMWWRGRVSFGWNIVNFGVNIGDDDPSLVHAGSGLRLRFGRYDDFLNIIIGADYQYYYLKYESYLSKHYGIHQGLGIANIRFNVCKAFSYSSLYLGCAGDFTFFTSSDDVSDNALNKNPIAIEPQIGIQGEKWDFGFYYRTFTDENGLFKYYKVLDNHHCGLFFTWYF